MRDLICAYADLLIEARNPRTAPRLCAHVAAQEIVHAAEAEGVAERALIAHPGDDYVMYVRRAFVDLKKQQASLLQRSGGSKGCAT